MQKSKCPVCSSDVIIDDGAYENDIVDCPVCNSVLEITTLHPATLGVVEDNSESGEEEE